MTPELEQLINQLNAGSLTLQKLEGHQDDPTEEIPKFTTCTVYTLHNENKQIVGYYKEEKYGLYGGALMNTLVYHISEILGLEKRIVPSAKQEPFSCNGQSYKGGTVQTAQEGISLKDYRESPEKRQSSILLDEYIEGIICSVVLGMFDAHSQNMLIDSTGGIHFFDLTRSLPHANTVINRGGYLEGPYVCSLLNESENASIISLKKRKELKERLKGFHQKLKDVKNYLLSFEAKKLIQELPQHWLYPVKAYQALKERIELLQEGFDQHRIQQVRDLVFCAFPFYRFICLLNYGMLLDWRSQVHDEFLLNRCLREINRPIFFQILPVPVESMIDECIKLGLDPMKIFECSQMETLTQSMSCFVHFVKDKLVHPETPVEQAFLKQQGEILKKNLKQSSEIDYKDWGEDYPDEDFFNS